MTDLLCGRGCLGLHLLETNPPSPIITIGVARAAKDLEGPGDMILIFAEEKAGLRHPVGAERHTLCLRIGRNPPQWRPARHC